MINIFSKEGICLSQNINGKLSALVPVECEVEGNSYKRICILWYVNYKQNVCVPAQCSAMISSPLTATLHSTMSQALLCLAPPATWSWVPPGIANIFPRWTHLAKPKATWTTFALCSVSHPFWEDGTVLSGLAGTSLGLDTLLPEVSSVCNFPVPHLIGNHWSSVRLLWKLKNV